jgi:UDP-2,4-diacetamido-2,4,6-trideoxy-beta-L-altropyranose hydrolase
VIDLSIRNILFRADSSSLIGTGHIMRDLVLAAQIKKKLPQATIYFATKNLPGNINYKILQQEYSLINILEDSKNELHNIALQNSIDFIIIDHYQIDINTEKYLSRLCDVLVFDDEFNDHNAKWVLNHSFTAQREEYNYLKESKILAGAQYTLLDDSFISKKHLYTPVNRLDNKSILITLGGSDPLYLSMKIKKYLLNNYTNIKVTIVTTHSNKRINYIKAVDKGTIINEERMSNLMQKYDLIITSASTSLLETFALKKPFIAIKCASNQAKTVDLLKKYNLDNVIEKFNFASLKKALNFVQYQPRKIKEILQKYKFEHDGVIQEIING